MKTGRKVIASVLLLLLLPGILLAVHLRLPHFYGDTYYAQLPAMVQRLDEAQGSRLILIGGSNIAFGIDTELLEDCLEAYGYSYTVCPLGLYAAVGSSAMLELAQRTVRAGDVVVLAIEPTTETMSTYFGATAFWKCAEENPRLLLRLGKEKSAALAGSFIPYLQERWSIYRSKDYPKAEGVYSRAAFSESCNMSYPREGNTLTLGFDPAVPINLAELEFQEDFVQQVNRFCTQAEKKGASVYWSFSPMNRSAVADGSRQALEQFFTRCNQSFCCPIISDPGQYLLDSGWFYDSNFHLNTAGAQLRTQLLCEDLLTILGCCQAVSFDAPAKPTSIAPPLKAQQGDDCFLFTVMENGGCLISGLKETGLKETTLTVPSMYNGLPVVGFSDDALVSAKQLEQLRLPSTILFLQEGVFRGCSSLARLILEHTDAPCPIDAHVLDDVPQLRVFVPESVYHLYRDGHGCQQNLWASYLDRVLTY